MNWRDVIREFVKHNLTERDGESYDIVRGTAALGGGAFVLFAAYDVFVLKRWDAVAYGIGFGSVLAALGAALRLNEGPSKPPKEPPT